MSAASNCVSLEFYYAIHCALAKCPAPQHAKSFHHVFTVCSMCSDIPKDSERSTCKLTWLITVSILRLCGLPEHDNRALVVLLETLPHCHGNHILFLQHVYQNAEPPLFCASQRMLNGILWTLLYQMKTPQHCCTTVGDSTSALLRSIFMDTAGWP